MTSISTHFKGVVRADIKNWRDSRFEVQVKYNDGWYSLISLSPDDVARGWTEVKKRYRSRRLRLLRNGKKVREQK